MGPRTLFSSGVVSEGSAFRNACSTKNKKDAQRRNNTSMINLAGKTAVVFGLANKRSIAWGIAQKLSAAGATLAICYQNERMKLEAEDLIKELPGADGFQCDVSVDSEIDTLYAALKEKFSKLDI